MDRYLCLSAFGHDTSIIIMGKETDKIESGSEGSYRLSTMLPFDVFTDFVKFCKKNTKTGIGKFDFGVGLRVLLMKAEYADRLQEMEKRIAHIELNLKEEIHG
jgi:hypothetical protein